jgi:hypothetical protein
MRFTLTLVLLTLAKGICAQTNTTQVWGEYMGNLGIGKRVNVEGAFTYSSALEQPKWRAYDLQFTPEFALNKHVDLMGALLFSHTFQTATLSTYEIREMLGVRYNINPGRKLLVRALYRFEQRNVEDRENNTWTHSTRSRLRLEGILALNKKNISDYNHVFYVLADGEAFVNFGKDVEERFANRFRYRLGGGYKLSKSFRFEFVYTLQTSVNALQGGIDSRENLLRFRVKQYF